MRTLIIDIETVGEAWSELDTVTQAGLTRWVDTTTRTPQEQDSLLTAIHEGLGFSPLTGCIVAIGVYDLERAQGAVYYTASLDARDEVVDGWIYKPRSELQMLTEFWEGARDYDTFVTFNGRSFDVPFLMHRSVVHGIKPTRELLKYRYLAQQSAPFHIDLQDELTWYGAMRKRPSLHMFCRAYGIESPKSTGVSGDDVATLYNEGKYRDIAVYNIGDVVATTQLYTKWREYLAPRSFLDIVDFQ